MQKQRYTKSILFPTLFTKALSLANAISYCCPPVTLVHKKVGLLLRVITLVCGDCKVGAESVLVKLPKAAVTVLLVVITKLIGVVELLTSPLQIIKV